MIGFLKLGKMRLDWLFCMPYKQFFTDQACSVKVTQDAWLDYFFGLNLILFFRFFFACWLTFTTSQSIKDLGQYPTILTEQAWSISLTYHGSILSIACVAADSFPFSGRAEIEQANEKRVSEGARQGWAKKLGRSREGVSNHSFAVSSRSRAFGKGKETAATQAIFG